jgi:MoxR-like ATPase
VLGLLRMEAVVADYIVELVHATRFPAEVKLPVARFIEFGASPRATLALAKAARAHALLAGRGYVTPDDVKAVGLDCLRHRVLLNYEAEADGVGVESVIESVFSHVRTP